VWYGKFAWSRRPRFARKACCRRHPLCFHTGPPSRARAGSLRTSPVNCIPVRRHVCALCPKGRQPFDLPFDTWTRPAPSSQGKYPERKVQVPVCKSALRTVASSILRQTLLCSPEMPRLATGHLRRIPVRVLVSP
jgi:hypothetical protein